MRLEGRKIAVLVEADYYEPELAYYEHRFAEEGAELHLVSRLWGQPSLTFLGHEYRAPLECRESLELLRDERLAELDALIVPSGMVADRLRYTDDLSRIPPATELLQRAFADRGLIKGIICHGLWLVAPAPELVRGRRLTCHNNLHGDALAYGARFVDRDLVVDDELVTARTGKHCHLLARQIIDLLAQREPRGQRQAELATV
jgi:protease I